MLYNIIIYKSNKSFPYPYVMTITMTMTNILLNINAYSNLVKYLL